MANFLSMIGYIGTALVIGAYAPQISHLWTEHCSAGISERAYAIWALAAAVFLGHAFMIGDAVFMITQLVNLVAMAIILVLARRFRNQICAAHARQLHVVGEGLNEQPKYSH
jgi:uncharacterized protein with PQ loop repeat